MSIKTILLEKNNAINNINNLFEYIENDFLFEINHINNYSCTVWINNGLGEARYNNKNVNKILKNPRTLDLRSEKEKFVFCIGDGIYHNLQDVFPYIIKIIEDKPNCEFHINTSRNRQRTENEFSGGGSFDYLFYEFLIRFLNHNNIKYYLYNDFSKIDYVVLNKFYMINAEFKIDIKNILDRNLYKYIKNKQTVPNKKVYLSRNSYFWRSNQEKDYFQQDVRIFNEHLLEEYLKNLGFEILRAEINFKTFEEQINYFYETKILMSTTNAGLTNCLFMQKNTQLIELVSPLLIGQEINNNFIENTVVLHNLWQPYQPINNSSYLALPNMTKDARDIISFIESNPKIKELLI